MVSTPVFCICIFSLVSIVLSASIGTKTGGALPDAWKSTFADFMKALDPSDSECYNDYVDEEVLKQCSTLMRLSGPCYHLYNMLECVCNSQSGNGVTFPRHNTSAMIDDLDYGPMCRNLSELYKHQSSGSIYLPCYISCRKSELKCMLFRRIFVGKLECQALKRTELTTIAAGVTSSPTHERENTTTVSAKEQTPKGGHSSIYISTMQPDIRLNTTARVSSDSITSEASKLHLNTTTVGKNLVETVVNATNIPATVHTSSIQPKSSIRPNTTLAATTITKVVNGGKTVTSEATKPYSTSLHPNTTLGAVGGGEVKTSAGTTSITHSSPVVATSKKATIASTVIAGSGDGEHVGTSDTGGDHGADGNPISNKDRESGVDSNVIEDTAIKGEHPLSRGVSVLTFFILAIVAGGGLYIAYQNKRKIITYIRVWKKGDRSRSREYKRVSTAAEDVVPSLKTPPPNAEFIY